MKKFAKVMAVVLVAVMSLALLVACGPNADPDKAVASLKKNEYAAGKDTLLAGTLKALGVADIDAVVKGTKSVKGDDNKTKIETVTIVYFKDSKAAEAAWEKLEKYADDQKGDSKDWTVGQTGALIYWGTTAAVKAAR